MFSTAAWGSGAYSLALPPDVYDVTATGPGLGGTFVANHLTIGNANVKLDITPAEVNQPRLTLLANGESISNGAFSPSAAAGTSFGLVALGAASPTQHFTVRNDGVRALDLSSLTLPAGFTAAGLEGVSVSPGQSFSFDIAMETSTPGAHGGSVVVASNDPSASAFQFNVAGFVGTTFLPRLYADLLGRSPDAAGLAAWSDALSTGTTGEAVASAFMQSEEYRTRQVQQAYQAILGRPADAGGQAYWRGFLAGNGTLEQMKAGLFGSAEFAAAHGNSDAEVVEGYYEGMFGRSGDNPGIAYWSSLLAAGYRRDQVAHTLLKSQESRNRTVERLYETYLHRPADAAGLGVWSAQLLPTGASETMVLAALLGSAEYIGS